VADAVEVPQKRFEVLFIDEIAQSHDYGETHVVFGLIENPKTRPYAQTGNHSDLQREGKHLGDDRQGLFAARTTSRPASSFPAKRVCAAEI